MKSLAHGPTMWFPRSFRISGRYPVPRSREQLRETLILNIINFEKNLYTKRLPHPDILIRTGGHQRLSNFMLWQLAYAELFFLKKLWPDFSENDLKKIINKFKLKIRFIVFLNKVF